MTRQRISGPPPCQVGTLAQLRRVDRAYAGRLVLVENSAPPVTAPGAWASMPAWRIYVLGRDLLISGAEYSSLIAAEACLQPLCVLNPRSARALCRAKAQHDADAAVEQLRRALQEHPMGEARLEIELKSAAGEALARHAAPLVLLPLGHT